VDGTDPTGLEENPGVLKTIFDVDTLWFMFGQRPDGSGGHEPINGGVYKHYAMDQATNFVVAMPFTRGGALAGATYGVVKQGARNLADWRQGRTLSALDLNDIQSFTITGGTLQLPLARFPRLGYPLLGLGLGQGGREIYQGRYEEGSVDVFAAGLGVYGLRRPLLSDITSFSSRPCPGSQAGTVRVFTTTDFPVDAGRPGTGAKGPGGIPTPKGVGGTFVTTTDISNPQALDLHIQRNVAPGGTMPRYVSELEANPTAVLADPTEAPLTFENGWIPPNAPGVSVVKVWEITWANDPRGFPVPVLNKVPRR